MPNSDTHGRIIFKLIDDFVKKNPNSRAYTSLGQLRYLSCIKYVDGVVGNSSSGLLEVPSFKKGTINIGDRQRGRIKATSIIDCKPNQESISQAIRKLYSNDFKNITESVKNPYGLGGASDKIVKVLEEVSFKNLLKKHFYNLSK